MNFYLDENLPPALARALNELSVDHRVASLKDEYPPGTPDVVWITDLGAKPDSVMITQDILRKGKLEREALKREGLLVFALASAWTSQRYWPKSAQLVQWWPRIIEQAGLVSGGAVFRVPWKVSGKGKFEQERL